jgi:hypothetical protein
LASEATGATAVDGVFIAVGLQIYAFPRPFSIRAAAGRAAAVLTGRAGFNKVFPPA